MRAAVCLRSADGARLRLVCFHGVMAWRCGVRLPQEAGTDRDVRRGHRDGCVSGGLRTWLETEEVTYASGWGPAITGDQQHALLCKG